MVGLDDLRGLFQHMILFFPSPLFSHRKNQGEGTY